MNRAALFAGIVIGTASWSPNGVWATNAESAGSAAPIPAAVPAPPPGWEMPPPLEKLSSVDKKKAPACCIHDPTCCSRQTDIDRFKPLHVTKTYEVRLADFPEAVIKETGTDGPYIEGVPPVRIVDGTGTPFPWTSGPKGGQVRIMPPGLLGEITFASSWATPYWEKKEYQSMGGGEVRNVSGPVPDKGHALVTGPLEYMIFNRGQNDTIVHDHVKGKLDGSPNVLATYWLHVEAAHLVEGIVHGFRAPRDGNAVAVFVMPETLLGFESKDAKTVGGFFPSRFFREVPYTMYRFPIGAGRSNMINATMRDWEVRRWFDRPKQATKLPERVFIVIAMSQTTVEREPRIRLLFTDISGD